MFAKMLSQKWGGFVVVFCIVTSPAIALASLEIFPEERDLGYVSIGASTTVIVTVMNPSEDLIAFVGDLSGDSSFLLSSELPSFINPGETIDIKITFAPGDEGYFSADLSVGGTVGTSFGGVGVPFEPPTEPTIESILTFFNLSEAIGTLVGNGPGNSAEGRKNALRNQIKAAGDLIGDGYIEEACDQLMNAYLRCDSLPTPPEFVAGHAAPTLAGMILDLVDALGGAVIQDLASEDGLLLGKALFCYDENRNKTDIYVSCWGLPAGTECTVLLCDCEYVECKPIGTVTAEQDGQTHLKVSCPEDLSAMCVVVAQGELPQGSVYELRSDGDVIVIMSRYPNDAVKKKASRMSLAR